MTDVPAQRRPLTLAIILIVTGAIGWYSSFALTVDKILVLQNPQADLDCNFSLLVQCGTNLQSWQGSVFGFPNPLIGLGGFVAPIAVGVAMLAGATFARWFWIAFGVGVAGAYGFTIWLQVQSFYFLGTLCPWCILVWAVTIPLFWTVWLHLLKSGIIPLPAGARRFFGKAYGFIPLITVLNYIEVALNAQIGLDWIGVLATTGSL